MCVRRSVVVIDVHECVYMNICVCLVYRGKSRPPLLITSHMHMQHVVININRAYA